MPRGGKRAGAGRKPGVANKRSVKEVAQILAEGISPLDVYRQVMPQLLASKDSAVLLAALDRAAKFRKLFHSEFAPSDNPARPHEQQEGLPLFDGPHVAPPAPLGKKEAAEQAAVNAAVGTGWGDLLETEKPN